MTDVLIAGGGTVGLSAAVFLAHHGVQVHVVEREVGPRTHPRATGLGPRTMELLREVGLADAVDAVAVDAPAGNLGKITAETLAAADLPSRPPAPPRTRPGGPTPWTPCTLRGTCPQNRLDAVLLPAARGLGAVVEYGVALDSFEQDDARVTARLSDGRTVTADFLVGADGTHSAIRRALGIASGGPGDLGDPLVNILFRADLGPLLGGRAFATCTITHPEADGLLVTIDGAKEWVFHSPRTRQPTPELIRTALGVPDLDVEIVSTLPWRVRGLVAERLRAGRVFLVGDAAHTVPPLGAFGLNTGIADAHNLAWKLALVLRGEAGPALLDSYEAERLPVARLTLEQAILRLADPALHWGRGPGAAKARAAAGVVNAPVVQVGHRYDSTAVVDPEPALPSTEDVALDLDGAPGSRLPHHWTGGTTRGERLSTLDLVRSRFTLLTGPAGAPAWHRAAEERGLPAHTVDIPEIPPGGALLVRPDGFIGWRARATTPEQLDGVMDRLLAKPARR